MQKELTLKDMFNRNTQGCTEIWECEDVGSIIIDDSYIDMDCIDVWLIEKESKFKLSEVKNMTFEQMLPYLKSGAKARRRGWNGKGMFVVMQKGYPNGIYCNKQTAEAWGLNEGDLFVCNPYFQIKNVNGSHSMWVPSVGDLLAGDWEIFFNIQKGE